jgi:hypothetical protein
MPSGDIESVRTSRNKASASAHIWEMNPDSFSLVNREVGDELADEIAGLNDVELTPTKPTGGSV